MTKTIYLLRHAKSAEGKLMFKGICDIPLSDDGRSEALAAKGFLGAIVPDLVYSSPLLRAMETAALVREDNWPEIERREELNDINCGEWENKEVEKVRRESSCVFNAWIERPGSFEFPGGESVFAASERAFKLIKEVLGRSDVKSALFVTHRLIINVAVLRSLAIDLDNYWSFKYDSCSYAKLDYDGHFTLAALNVKARGA